MPSYLPRQYLKGYFTKRFEKSQIKKYIQFETVVKNINFMIGPDRDKSKGFLTKDEIEEVQK